MSKLCLVDVVVVYSYYDSEKLKKENLDVTFVLLDVTKIETIKATRDAIEKNDGRLDVLVNNAGRVYTLRLGLND